MTTTSLDSDLVPGRACGTCTVCCKTLKIDAPELKKLADVLCGHCTASGCKIYEARPAVCAAWYCAWRKIPQLTDHWRPDRCGVLVCFVGAGEGIPAEFPQLGLKFDIVESPRVLVWDPLIKFIASEVARGRPVFLGVPTPVGYERRKIFLNYAMAPLVRTGERQPMVQCLEAAYRAAMRESLREKTVFA
jgi:hypothetical protein